MAAFFAIALLLGGGCGSNERNHVRITNAQAVALGTPIDNTILPADLPTRFVLVLVSDCSSCTSTILDLEKTPASPKRLILTAHPSLAEDVRSEWADDTVIVDSNLSVLPQICYRMTPQLFLIEDYAVVDVAIGAVDANKRWLEWSAN